MVSLDCMIGIDTLQESYVQGEICAVDQLDVLNSVEELLVELAQLVSTGKKARFCSCNLTDSDCEILPQSLVVIFALTGDDRG